MASQHKSHLLGHSHKQDTVYRTSPPPSMISSLAIGFCFVSFTPRSARVGEYQSDQISRRGRVGGEGGVVTKYCIADKLHNRVTLSENCVAI